MEPMNSVKFDEKQKLNDLLSSQKYLTGVYNSYYCESATTEVKNCLSSILRDGHRIQEEIFDTMNNKGWYSVEKAEESKVNSAKQKFSQSASN